MPDAPKSRTDLLRLMADAVWEKQRHQAPTAAIRATFLYQEMLSVVTIALRAIEAACTVVPKETTEDIELRGLIAELAKIVANHSFGTTDQHSAFALLKRAAALAAGPYREG